MFDTYKTLKEFQEALANMLKTPNSKNTDRLAHAINIKRIPGESDLSLRNRILTVTEMDSIDRHK